MYVIVGRIQEFGVVGMHESPFPDLPPTLAKHPEPPSKFHKGWEREATHDAGGADLASPAPRETVAEENTLIYSDWQYLCG